MDNQVKRMLIITNTMNIGGAETFVMKMYRTINRNKLQFDFLINNPEINFYENEIKELGGKVYKGISKKEHPIKSFHNIVQTVKAENYKYVMRLSEHPIAYMDLLAAKFGGADKLIARSTNTRAGGKVGSVLAPIFRPLINWITDIKLAPSTEAGVWLFGEKRMREGEVLKLNNGIDLNDYRYNSNVRKRIRDEFHIQDEYVIGHVGRFNRQKNHEFLIDIFNAYIKMNPHTKLLLVGIGELEDEINSKVYNLGLEESVIFAGQRQDVNALYSAMDVIVFPSLYEGMPNVIIEAQATGLPCVISDRITQEVVLTNFVVQLQIGNIDDWCREVNKIRNIHIDRENKTIINNEYDIKNVVNTFVTAIGCRY